MNDIYIYNEDGKELAIMKCNKNTHFNFREGNFCELYIKDAILNTDIFKIFGEKEIKISNDYDSLLNENKENYETYTYGKILAICCKLIIVGLMRNVNTGNDHKYKIEVPKAKFINNFSLYIDNKNPSTFHYQFKIEKFNDNGDFFKFHYQKEV